MDLERVTSKKMSYVVSIYPHNELKLHILVEYNTPDHTADYKNISSC